MGTKLLGRLNKWHNTIITTSIGRASLFLPSVTRMVNVHCGRTDSFGKPKKWMRVYKTKMTSPKSYRL